MFSFKKKKNENLARMTTHTPLRILSRKDKTPVDRKITNLIIGVLAK